MDAIIIGDVHTEYSVPNDRLTWLGKYILDSRPDLIIQVGDFNDMPSLSSYDVGKAAYDGRRYAKDVAAGIDAQEKLFAPINEHNSKCRSTRSGFYTPKKIILGGNHDEKRISRAANDVPYLEGTISVEDLKYRQYWDEYVPFLRRKIIEKISFCHFFTKGNMGNAISGVSPAKSLLDKLHFSCVQGHSHLYNEMSTTNAAGELIFAMHAGCYFDHPVDYVDETIQAAWWRGVITLRDMKNGYYEGQNRVTLAELKAGLWNCATMKVAIERLYAYGGALMFALFGYYIGYHQAQMDSCSAPIEFYKCALMSR